MKHSNFVLAFIFATFLFSSCKKDNENFSENIQSSENGIVTFKDGMVNFSSFNVYNKTIENRNGEQAALFDKLQRENFSSLKSQPSIAAPASFNSNNINSFTNAFNPELYTDYLLSVLNSDKIFTLDGFWIKVDMDNKICNALDKTLYPNELNDLISNSTSNTHIMRFLNQDEPVLDALKAIRDGSQTWASYQDLVSRKGGQGICFRRGASDQYDSRDRIITGSPFTITARAAYLRNFLSFQLQARGFIGSNTGAIGSLNRIQGNFGWEGVCRGSDNGNFTEYTKSWSISKNLYSGGSALYSGNLTTTTYPQNYSQIISARIAF
jgi:hypothetical protein